MSTATRILAGCFLTPFLLVASCAGKMFWDAKMYDLPGEVLQATVPPTQKLSSAIQVAEALDSYVQPRFEILRDKNFGALRIVYRKHAGIVQLKVDTPQEQELIANVNATSRDYAICLMHCAPKPPYSTYSVTPKLQMLYFNRQQVVSDKRGISLSRSATVAAEKGLPWESIEKKAIAALPTLKTGKEYRAEEGPWTLLMRPVLAAKQECISCHTGEKPDATLGVMVYAVRSDKKATVAELPTPRFRVP